VVSQLGNRCQPKRGRNQIVWSHDNP
jgi:hypothetical protein